MAQHGWKVRPSPRRGFTVVEASREPESPVVTTVYDRPQGLRLFRTALDEAMSRSCDLVVLDCGRRSLREELEDTSDFETREMSDMRALLINPHVRVLRVEPHEADLENTVAYCELVKATLLIISAEQMSGRALDAALTNRIFHGDFDVLVVTDNPTEERRHR